jgi:zinc protease
VAATYFKLSNRTVGVFIPTEKPDRSEIPGRPDVVAMLKDYKGEAAVAMDEAFDPSPANIESRAMRSTTPSGMKLVFVPKKTRGGKVFARLTLRFGNEQALMTGTDRFAGISGSRAAGRCFHYAATPALALSERSSALRRNV